MKFDVLNEPWIPVTDKNGKAFETGLYPLLKNAHELSEVRCDSPLETYAVQRFIIAFLMDAYAPERPKHLKRILEGEKFDMGVIDAYIETCRSEGVTFDLFDKERPFMQARYDEKLDKEKETSAAKLFHALPTGNNHLHFDHTPEDERSFAPAKCLRGILATQLFAVSMAQGYPSSVNDTPCYYVLIQGKNLFETLVCSMGAKNEFSCNWNDMPAAWRETQPVIPKSEFADLSVAAGLTWQPRRIRLIPAEDGTVGEIIFQQGRNFHPNGKWKDPHVSFRINEKTGEAYSLKPKADRLPWRDIGTFIVSENNKNSIPAAIVQHYPIIADSKIITIQLFGLITDNAKYSGWIEDKLSIPIDIAENCEKADRLRLDIAFAENVASVLSKAVRQIERAASRSKDSKNKNGQLTENVKAAFFAQLHNYIFGEYMQRLEAAELSQANWFENFVSDMTDTTLGIAQKLLKDTANELGSTAAEFKEQNIALSSFYKEISKLKKERECRTNEN